MMSRIMFIPHMHTTYILQIPTKNIWQNMVFRHFQGDRMVFTIQLAKREHKDGGDVIGDHLLLRCGCSDLSAGDQVCGC